MSMLGEHGLNTEVDKGGEWALYVAVGRLVWRHDSKLFDVRRGKTIVSEVERWW